MPSDELRGMPLAVYLLKSLLKTYFERESKYMEVSRNDELQLKMNSEGTGSEEHFSFCKHRLSADSELSSAMAP